MFAVARNVGQDRAFVRGQSHVIHDGAVGPYPGVGGPCVAACRGGGWQENKFYWGPRLFPVPLGRNDRQEEPVAGRVAADGVWGADTTDSRPGRIGDRRRWCGFRRFRQCQVSALTQRKNLPSYASSGLGGSLYHSHRDFMPPPPWPLRPSPRCHAGRVRTGWPMLRSGRQGVGRKRRSAHRLRRILRRLIANLSLSRMFSQGVRVPPPAFPLIEGFPKHL